MFQEFITITEQLLKLISEWENILNNLTIDILTQRKNSQNRTIKQILGHLIDSASNNTHRIVYLQYKQSPFNLPNYATNGDNDRWIAIQDYQNEDWNSLVFLWKYSNLHLVHVIKNVNPEKLENKWFYNNEKLFTLKEIIVDYLRHFNLHLSEIDELILNK